jgi:GT2 family glycosyltransferase
MPAMHVSIIIPTCNRPEALAVCLEALVPQLHGASDIEVLVLDDGSNLATCHMIGEKLPQARWYAGPRRGPAANRNLGASKADGEWLIFLDDDCIPAPDWLDAYLQGMPRAGVMIALCGATRGVGVRKSLLWEAPHNPDGELLISCNFAIRRNEFLQVGGFDERYPMAAFEDTEFAERFFRHQGHVTFLPQASVDHPWRPLPPARTLARRWEARVIYAFDQGASARTILWRLPWHVLLVLQSRLREQRWSGKHLRALMVFAKEWLLVTCLTFAWVRKWGKRPRSEFWTAEVNRTGAVAKYGF